MAKVTVKCYGKEETYSSRAKAIQEFKTAICCSEGSEQSRYVNILRQLQDGNRFCSDETTI